MNDIDAEIMLSNDDRIIIENNPSIFNDIYDDIQRANLLHHWPLIIAAITDKAKRGDVASAKFIHDFIEPLALARATGETIQHEEWSDLAIALRDALQLELSAEALVIIILRELAKPSNKRTLLRLLNPK